MNLNEIELALVAAEDSLLGCCINGTGAQVWAALTPEDFTEGQRRTLALALHRLHRDGYTAPDVAQVASAVAGVSRGVDAAYLGRLAGLMNPFPAYWLGERQELLAKRAALRMLMRAQADIESGTDLWTVLDDMGDSMSKVKPPDDANVVPWWTYDDVLSFDDAAHRSVIPSLLDEGERVVITGAEGHGKSTLIYQLCLSAAWGVHPFDTSQRFEPKRVFMLDVENWHETQVKRQYRTVSTPLRLIDKTVEPQIALSKIRQIDLLRSDNRSSLMWAVERFKPDLLFMGSGYKLVDMDDFQKMALSIQRTADAARDAVGTSVIIETHAGHGFQNSRNGWRPDGSSYWMRWPEFGIGLEPVDASKGIGPLKVIKWRGDRRTDNGWPAGFTPGGSLPWTGIKADEWEARFS